MKNRFLLILFFVFLIYLVGGIGLIRAADQSLEINYNSTLGGSIEKDVEFSSVLLKVLTEVDSTCKYDLVSGGDYDDMEENFDLSADKLHKKTFSDLSDGIYKYYIKCLEDSSSQEPAELKLILRVDAPVSAKIILSEEPPLSYGKLDVTLSTSEVVSQTPSLSYSFDGISYDDLPLFGSGKIWEGYLVIPKNLGEAALSFKFKANDLEGRLGTSLTGESVFFIDTVKPRLISDIKAIGYEGKIRLEWYFDDEVREFNIYRSTSQNSDYTDFYKSIDYDDDDDDYDGNYFFYDTLVEKGKTYYYRVSAVDNSGNEGDLSREVFSTALINNESSDYGLAPELRSLVDNLLVEIDFIDSEISKIKKSISSKSDEERTLFSNLRLENEIEGSVSELSTLRKTVENYKLQDLTENSLNNKLDSAQIKLNIIKKKVPEGMVVIEKDSFAEEVDEQRVYEGILKLEPQILDKIKEKSVEETLQLVEDSGLSIISNVYVIRIIYLDGSEKEISVVKKAIYAELENEKNTYFIEIIPSSLVDKISSIEVINFDYDIVNEDSLSFSSDTKEIIYSIPENLNINKLKEIKLSLIRIYQEEEFNSSSSITGYFLLDPENRGYIGIVVGIVLVLIIGVYFWYLVRKRLKGRALEIYNKIEEGLVFLDKNDLKGAIEIYNSAREDYSGIEKKYKKKIFKKLNYLHNEIIVFKLEEGLKKLEVRKDKELFDKLEKIYNNLSEDYKKTLSTFFEKIKKDMEEWDEK